MISDKDINRALVILGLDDYVITCPSGFDGIAIDKINMAGCLDDRAYYFEDIDSFDDFIRDIIN